MQIINWCKNPKVLYNIKDIASTTYAFFFGIFNIGCSCLISHLIYTFMLPMMVSPILKWAYASTLIFLCLFSIFIQLAYIYANFKKMDNLAHVSSAMSLLMVLSAMGILMDLALWKFYVEGRFIFGIAPLILTIIFTILVISLILSGYLTEKERFNLYKDTLFETNLNEYGNYKINNIISCLIVLILLYLLSLYLHIVIL